MKEGVVSVWTRQNQKGLEEWSRCRENPTLRLRIGRLFQRIFDRKIKKIGLRPSAEYVKEKLGDNLKVAEVGVAWGKNAEKILTNLDIQRLDLIDLWLSKRMKKRCEELFGEKENVKLFESDSTAEELKHKLSPPYDYIYIDASHNYKDTLKELNFYYPLVKEGGILGGHDWSREGVWKAVTEVFDKEQIITYGNDWWVHKK